MQADFWNAKFLKCCSKGLRFRRERSKGKIDSTKFDISKSFATQSSLFPCPCDFRD